MAGRVGNEENRGRFERGSCRRRAGGESRQKFKSGTSADEYENGRCHAGGAIAHARGLHLTGSKNQ